MKLINAAACKKMALQIEDARFPNFPKLRRTRVSREFLELLDAKLEGIIREIVFNRSNGKGSKTI